jgi:hypothetical protein
MAALRAASLWDGRLLGHAPLRFVILLGFGGWDLGFFIPYFSLHLSF